MRLRSVLSTLFFLSAGSLLPAHDSFAPTNVRLVQPDASFLRSSDQTVIEPVTDEVKELLSEAASATVKKDYEKAKSLYEQASKLSAAHGYPALARFLKLTASQDEIAAFSDDILKRDDLAISLRARILNQLGDRNGAIGLLESAKEDLSVAETITLSQLLRKNKEQSKGDQAVLDYALKTQNEMELTLLAEHFFSRTGIPFSNDAEHLVQSLNTFTPHFKADAFELRQLIDGMILDWQTGSDYFSTRDQVLEEGKSAGYSSLYFCARMLVLEQRQEEAMDLILTSDLLSSDFTETNQLPPVMRQEFNELLKQLGLADNQQDNTQEEIISDAKKLQEVRRLIRAEEFDSAFELYDEINAEALRTRDQKREFARLSIEEAAYQKDIQTLIDRYQQNTDLFDYESRLDLHDQLYEYLRDTAQHLEIEERIREMKANSALKTPPSLWLLAASAANMSKLKQNELEALYSYSLEAPNDIQVLQQIARESTQIAIELHNAPDEELVQYNIPLDQRGFIYTLAEKTNQALIQAMPYSPEGMVQLMRLYRETDQEELAPTVPDLVGATADNPRIFENCGYVLATEGYPEKALEYYDRALELKPKDLGILTNRAAALTRLDRWDEAIAFYKDVIENGYDGKVWHIHDYIIRLWDYTQVDSMEERSRREEAYREYFREVTSRDLPWIDKLCSDLLSLNIYVGDLDEASYYGAKLFETSSDAELRARCWEKLAQAYAKQNDPDKATELLKQSIEDLKEDPGLQIPMMQNLAFHLLQQGNMDEAIKAFEDTATAYPNDSTACDSLFYAAQTLLDAGDNERAEKFLQQFIDSQSRSFGLRQKAEQRLQLLALSTE